VDRTAGARIWNRHAAWLLLFAVIFAPTVYWLWQRWTMSVWHNTHGALIPFVVAYLVRDSLRRDESREESSSAWGFLFLVTGLLLVVVDSAIRTQLLAAFGLVLCLPGLSLLLLGARRTRQLAFPLTLAFFMLPIPAAFVQRVMLLLREISAVGAAELLSLVGVPVLREHTMLHLSGSSLMVADACSGFSTLYSAVTMALLLAYLTPSRIRRVVILAAAAPAAIIANVLRCAALSLMVQGWGTEFLETWLHPFTGLASFGLALAVLMMLAGRPLLKRLAE
jgi:exosortase